MHDTFYFDQSVNSSQSLNNSYGYLWWLNGKSSFRIPSSQFILPGSYAPASTADKFAGIGKNGLIVSIAPLLNLVIIRMGESSSDINHLPFALWNKIWENLNYVLCNNAVTNYTFNGNSYWNIAANWSNNTISPLILSGSTQIFIHPVLNKECIINVPQIMSKKSSISVATE